MLLEIVGLDNVEDIMDDGEIADKGAVAELGRANDIISMLIQEVKI